MPHRHCNWDQREFHLHRQITHKHAHTHTCKREETANRAAVSALFKGVMAALSYGEQELFASWSVTFIVRKWACAFSFSLHRRTDQPCGRASWPSLPAFVSECPWWLRGGLTGGSPADTSDPQISARLPPFLTALVYPCSLELPSPFELSPWLVWCSTRLEWRTVGLTTLSSTICTPPSTVWSLSWVWSPTVLRSLCSASGWRCATRPQCLWLT